MTAPVLPAFLSPQQLADYLGVPVGSVYRWRKYRQGPIAVRVGKHIRFAREDVMTWLDGQRETAPTGPSTSDARRAATQRASI